MQRKSGDRTSDQLQEASLVPSQDIVNLPKCFYYKEGYLMSLTEEVDLALSLFFYCIIF